MNTRSGLTLVELVVVLLILVLVAGTALTATEGLVGETRYEATRTELRRIEAALLGSYDAGSSGEPTAISFAADVGRLPKVRGGEPESALSELWIAPPLMSAFSIQRPAGDTDVQIPGGWRGPYIRVPLGLGDTYLLDGWSRPYELLLADGATPCPPDAEIAMIRSLGADEAPGGTSYDADVTLVLDGAMPVVGPRHLGDVPVRVTNTGSVGAIYLRIYGPRDGLVVTLEQTAPFPATGVDIVHVFENVSVGPRVVRAYRSTIAPTTVDAPFDDPSDVRSRAVHVTVVQGGVAEVELELP